MVIITWNDVYICSHWQKPIALSLLFLRYIILIANIVYIRDLGLQPLEIWQNIPLQSEINLEITDIHSLGYWNSFLNNQGWKRKNKGRRHLGIPRSNTSSYVPTIYFCARVHLCMLSCFSCVQLYVTLWTVGCQASLSMGFSRQEYWSGMPRPPPGDVLDPWSNPCLLPCQTGFSPLAPLEHPEYWLLI